MTHRWVYTAMVTSLAIGAVAPVCVAQEKLTQLIEKAKHGVVLITSTSANGHSTSAGTGFFVADGNVVTNFHVIKDAVEVKLTLSDGTTLTAEGWVGRSITDDLIVLAVSVTDKVIKPLPLEITEPRVGERVFVMGNSLGMGLSVSEGIVSALRNDETFGRILQITAPISHGNSGGPVLNMDGKVIGIATAFFVGGQNLNIAILSTRIQVMELGSIRPFKPDDTPTPVSSFPKIAHAFPEILNRLSRSQRLLVEERCKDYFRLPNGIWLDGYRIRRIRHEIKLKPHEDEALSPTTGANVTREGVPDYYEIVGRSLGANDQRVLLFVDVPSSRHVYIHQVVSKTEILAAWNENSWVHIHGSLQEESLIDDMYLSSDFLLIPTGEYSYTNTIGARRTVPSYQIIYISDWPATAADVALAVQQGETKLFYRSFRRSSRQKRRVTLTEFGMPIKHTNVGHPIVTYKWKSRLITLRFKTQPKQK